MAEVIGVRFQRSGKITYFDPTGIYLEKGSGVLVETDRGVEYGTVWISNINLPEEMLPQEIMPIVRVASEEDKHNDLENMQLAKDAYALCETKIKEHGLDMRLVEAEYTFDRNKLIFYFTSEERVDFRSLVRDLAQIFHTRIELRQIGVRDQTRMLGAIGSCGQEVCCKRYMDDFVPVSIKMAKTQGLSLNPGKISGICGRLMCCLNYEQEHYLENMKKVPPKGTLVLTVDGQGYVVDRDTLQTRVRVHVYKSDGTEDEHYYAVDDIEVLEHRKKGQPKPELLDSLENHVFVTEKEKREKKEQTQKERSKGGCDGCACPQKSDFRENSELIYEENAPKETKKQPYSMKGRVRPGTARRGRKRKR